jgi:RHS repeat-associated protein
MSELVRRCFYTTTKSLCYVYPRRRAHVDSVNSTTNYGTSTTLRADNSPILNSYLRFDVQGLTGSITSATLRIYANSSSSTGYTLHPVTDNTWTETGITIGNAPAMGGQLGSSGSFSTGTWTTVDITPYITGNGTYNFAFSTGSSTNISFSSREGTNDPELVIVTSDGATHTPTATATNTAGPSPTPTNTGVATPTKTATPTATNTPTRTPTLAGSITPTVPPTTPPPPFQSAEFDYDGDGKRVKSTINGTTTTYFIGTHYEVTNPGANQTVTKYYYAGAQRIALRTGNTLSYLLGDHLGSTSLTTDAAGNKVSEMYYKAWGEVRYASGNVPTKYQYTGQFSYVSDFGLHFYNARWYDSSLGRFAQADTIVPPGVQGYDRYAYVGNNPILYDDPSGHCGWCGGEIDFGLSLASQFFPRASQASKQAFGLVVSWFFQTGKEKREFGPTEPITQEVMKQSGVDDFHEEWASEGYPDGFTTPTYIDQRDELPPIPGFINWGVTLVQSHGIDLPLALLGDDDHSAIPGTIGSLDEITANYTEDGRVQITVHNTMGRASGLRIFTWTPLENVDRSLALFGGTTKQEFYWYEDLPRGKKGPR